MHHRMKVQSPNSIQNQTSQNRCLNRMSQTRNPNWSPILNQIQTRSWNPSPNPNRIHWSLYRS
jgi:hypothetical protein